MRKVRFPVFGAIGLALLLGLPAAATAQSVQYKETLTAEEFIDIHGTTDRYELLAMELKGDCAQCHKKRAEFEGFVTPGYKYRDIDKGGETLRPYDPLDSWPVGAFDVYYRNPNWGRFEAQGEYFGEDYYQTELNTRYLNYVSTTVKSQQFPHNEERELFAPSSGETPVPVYNPDDQDPTADYTKDIGEHSVALRAGPASYPAHLRLKARRYSTGGAMQQQFLDENCTSNCHNVSQKRKLDGVTYEAEGGADAHLGYAAASATFNYTEYLDDKNDPEWDYEGLSGGLGAGVSAHNTFPDVRAYEVHLAANTMSTGKISGSTGFNMGNRKNEDSNIEENYYSGQANFLWRPHRMVGLALKYRRVHMEDDVTSSDKALRAAGGLPEEYGLTEDRYAAALTFSPWNNVSLKGDVSYSTKDRDENEAFGMPGTTKTTSWKATLSYKPVRRVSLRAAYGMDDIDDPPYENSPTEASRLDLWASVRLWRALELHGSWMMVDSKNDDTDFENNRSIGQAGLVLTPVSWLMVSGHYSRFDLDVTQSQANIESDPGGIDLGLTDDVPFDATGNHYVFELTVRPVERLSLTGGYAYLDADGKMKTTSSVIGDVGSFSKFDANQEDISLGLQYETEGGWGLRTKAVRSTYEQDNVDNDEEVRELELLLSKRW